MCAQTMNRRTSAPASPCKNCGFDVGHSPSMHKCHQQQQQQSNRYISPLPAQRRLSSNSNQPLQVSRKPIHSSPERLSYSGSYSHLDSTSPTSVYHSSSSSPALSDTTTTTTASPSPFRGKWSRLNQKLQQHSYSPSDDNDYSNYLNNFTEHLPQQERKTTRLWNKVRYTQGDFQKPGGKLWGKLQQAAQRMADKIPSYDDKGPESDESDWEGETHVSRILREYYVKKHRRLPRWLHDDLGTPNTVTNHQHDRNDEISALSPTIFRRRLWDQEQQTSIQQGNGNHRNYQKQSNTNDLNNESMTSRNRHYDGRRNHHHRDDRHDLYQEQHDSMDSNGGFSTSFHHDRLNGPRLRPNNHNHH